MDHFALLRGQASQGRLEPGPLIVIYAPAAGRFEQPAGRQALDVREAPASPPDVPPAFVSDGRSQVALAGRDVPTPP